MTHTDVFVDLRDDIESRLASVNPQSIDHTVLRTYSQLVGILGKGSTPPTATLEALKSQLESQLVDPTLDFNLLRTYSYLVTALGEGGSGTPADPLAGFFDSFWPTDGTGRDAIGSNHLSLRNGVSPDYDLGIIGGALIGNGAGASTGRRCLEIADNPSLSTGNNVSFTVACWVYISSDGIDQFFVGKYDADVDGSREWVLGHDPVIDRFYFRIYSVPSGDYFVNASTPSAPALNTWHCIIAWLDAGSGTLNISVNDGVVYGAFVPSVFDSSAAFRIGAIYSDPRYGILGRIGDVGWAKNKIISIEERSAFYGNGAGWNP